MLHHTPSSVKPTAMLTPATIKAWRLSQGFTQAKAAELLGVGAGTVWRWENGAHAIPLWVTQSVMNINIIYKLRAMWRRSYRQQKARKQAQAREVDPDSYL